MTTRPKRDLTRLVGTMMSVNPDVHGSIAYVFKGAVHHLVHGLPLCSACETDMCTLVANHATEPHLADLAMDALHYGRENANG